ncbi:hypothetical protein [Sulfurimonas sp.]|uniref:hypothetical protein n=1 Tax=Sulfurimonas sp. TaxID=2022749 RepID=UPI003D0F6960
MGAKLDELVLLALERTYKGDKGFEFENFAQKISRCKHGDDYFATSPFKDGGVDGFKDRFSEELVVSKHRKPGIIYQYGTTEDFEKKIRSTYHSLKHNGINVTKINYFTARSISQLTKHIDSLEDELDIAVSITDQAQFCVMAANSECKKIFQEFVATMIGSLEDEADKNIRLDYPSLYLSAWYKYENRTEANKTITNIADSLIIWALRNTDPDKNIFMHEHQIYETIEQEFPTAKHSIKSIFRDRLAHLNKLRTEFSRQSIQKHKQGYCLPKETREDFQEKNQNSKELLLLTKSSVLKRLEEQGCIKHKEEIVELLLFSIKNIYMKQGMKLLQSITSDDEESYNDLSLIDAVESAIEELTNYTYTHKNKELVYRVLRAMLVNPDHIEQEYLTRSCYLYIMHYIMHNNMDIVNYFDERTKRLSLIVHSDIIVLAMSEEYLPKEGQHYRNMLAYLNQQGAELIMTEESLTEIYMQLHIASLSYRHDIQPFENDFTASSVKYIPVLMTRAYMYNKIDRLVSSWEEFVNNFCTPMNALNKSYQVQAKEELKIYLTDKYKLEYLSSHELKENIDTAVADALTQILIPHKKKPIMAEHVANVNVYISTLRDRNKEVSSNPFGYQTYWLTREKTVYNSAKDFFNKHQLGRRLIMRPEFIMEQIILTPDSKSIAKSYTSTFPTALGIQMSQQLSIPTFTRIMKKLNEIKGLDESRAKALLNNVIQITAEDTTLTHDLSVYEQEDVLLDTDAEEMHESFKMKLESIIKQAEKKTQSK